MGKRFALVGQGNIGTEVKRRVAESGDEIIDFDERRDEWGKVNGVDLAFLAIPTEDNGEIALYYIERFLEKGIPIVTCEKGALSNYLPNLMDRLDMIGYSATVGGGTRMLHFLKSHVDSNVGEVHAVVNGTLNYIFDEASRGRSLGEVVNEAKRLGYAEPGDGSVLDTINRETCSDVPMKSAILFTLSGLSNKIVSARDLNSRKLKKHDLDKLVRESKSRRYIVSITRGCLENEDLTLFDYVQGNWHLSGGFRNVDDNPLFSKLKFEGVDNGVVIYTGNYGGDGTYTLFGQGAGVRPTVSAMMKDAGDLSRKNVN